MLREELLESWADGNEDNGDAALDIALALGEKRLLPDGWVKAMTSGEGDPLFQGRVLLVQAYLDSDWEQVARVSSALTKSYPKRYSLFWYEGLALQHLGRLKEASEALGPYLAHAKDDLDYPKAVILAKALAADAAPAG